MGGRQTRSLRKICFKVKSLPIADRLIFQPTLTFRNQYFEYRLGYPTLIAIFGDVPPTWSGRNGASLDAPWYALSNGVWLGPVESLKILPRCFYFLGSTGLIRSTFDFGDINFWNLIFEYRLVFPTLIAIFGDVPPTWAGLNGASIDAPGCTLSNGIWLGPFESLKILTRCFYFLGSAGLIRSTFDFSRH